MATRIVTIAINGATGRMGTHHHLQRSLLAIRRDGGLPLANGDRLIPEPLILGRNADKLRALAQSLGIERWSTDLDAVLSDPTVDIFFDCSATGGRAALAHRVIAARKHIYLEKPTAETLEDALSIARAAAKAGLKNGVIQDKVNLPGPRKLALVRDSGFLGKLLAARLEFGWWVFDGMLQPCQRSSWNYRRADGGGLVLDMFQHWRYMIDRLLGEVHAITCRTATLTPRRIDERGRAYDVDVEDAAYATVELQSGAMVELSSSWCTRVRRDDLMTLHVDGTQGSAVAGLHRCWTQSLANTPKPYFNPDEPQTMRFHEQWSEVPDNLPHQNPFRTCWESFLRHWAEDAPFTSTLLEGAKGVQLADAAYRSENERRWIELPQLSV